jgi:hypothetical protein
MMASEWAQVGELKIRHSSTKLRIGTIVVRRSGRGIVEIDMRCGEPEVSLEIAPDIALALADLLMDASAPTPGGSNA